MIFILFFIFLFFAYWIWDSINTYRLNKFAENLLAKFDFEKENKDIGSTIKYFKEGKFLFLGKKLKTYSDFIREDIKNMFVEDSLLKRTKKASQNICETCGAKMKIRHGKFGKFWGCSRYPQCRFTKNIGRKK